MRFLVPALILPSLALAAPDPLDGEAGWRFAICRTEAICQLDQQSCIAMVAPGQSYIWRDEDGFRFGGSARMAVPVGIHATPTDALDVLTPDSHGPVLIIPTAQNDPEALQVAHFDVIAGQLSNRFDRMLCETRDEAPVEPPTGPEIPSPPEVLPPTQAPEALE